MSQRGRSTAEGDSLFIHLLSRYGYLSCPRAAVRIRMGRPPFRRSCRFDGEPPSVFVFTHNTQRCRSASLALVFAHPPHPFSVGTGLLHRISAATTLADSPTEFRAHRRSFTDLAPARRGASVNFFCHLAAPDLVNGGESPEFSGRFLESFSVYSGSSAGGILIVPEFSPRILRTQQAFSDPEFLPAALWNSD